MYIYTVQAMPGYKAKFDGDTSVKYNVKRKHTPASAKLKSSTDVIRTDLDYTAATTLVKKFKVIIPSKQVREVIHYSRTDLL